MAPKVSPLSNKRVDLVPETAGLVESVAPGSFGSELGLSQGDRVVSVNNEPLVDVLEFQYATSDDRMTLEVERDGTRSRLDLQLSGEERWGVTFADATFDGVHICENTCPFCFIKQIPKGMRKSLYVMDDDYRYSMLYGSFVTLTNLTEEDWQRIEEQKLGPMHVSVHSTDPDLRAALVGSPKGAKIMEDLGRLERAGIEFHAQLVLCPGINDGAELDRSLSDLSRFSRLASVAGVPVGLTRHGLERQSKQLRKSRTCMRNLPGADIHVRRYEAGEASTVIEHSTKWQEHFRQARGETFFYLGDEFYLMTGQKVPKSFHYDGFPQIEDGIGITRHLLDNLDEVLSRTPQGSLEGAAGTIACGTLIGPTMQEATRHLNNHTGAELDVEVLENTFFGPEINVSGLLTGESLIDGLACRKDPGTPIYISQRMVSDRTHTLLDDLTLPEVSGRLDADVVPALTFEEVVADLQLRQEHLKAA